MPKLKSASSIERINKRLKRDLDNSPSYKQNNIGKGIGNSRNAEPLPRFSQADGERLLEAGTNANIVIGKDRPASKLSGYGGRGDNAAGTIDMVTGRMSHNPATTNDSNETVYADPNFKIDASRIYISQKTDIDANFDLVPGKVGESTARAAIGIKSDSIRIIGREGIKLVTATDVKNSTGEKIISIAGIDLIAGNDDSDLQPLVLGNNVNESLKKLSDFVDKLAGIVSSAITYQMKFNQDVMTHVHISPFFGIQTAPSETLIPSGVEVMKNHGVKTIPDIVKFRTNIKFHKQTFYAVSGKKYINSGFNNTN